MINKFFYMVTLILVVFITQTVSASNHQLFDFNNIDVSKFSSIQIKPKQKFQSNDDLRVDEFGSMSSGSIIDVVVGESDASFALSGFTSDPIEAVVILKVVDPNNTTIYALDISGGQIDENTPVFGNISNFPMGNFGEFSLLMPMNGHTDGMLKVGTYKVTVITLNNNLILGVKALYKQKTTQPQSIDINYLVIDRDEDFTNESYLQNFFNEVRIEMDIILTPYNLSVGKINYKVANSEVIDEFHHHNADLLVTDPSVNQKLCNALSTEFGNGRAINIALVETISGNRLGQSPSVPGGVMDANSRINCVFVAQRGVGSTKRFARLFLHETGHYLSLPHTSNPSGNTFDFFSDTPQCDLATYDNNNNNQTSVSECGVAGGANNLMFYGTTLNESVILSTQQVEIIKAHPYLYPTNDSMNIDASTTGAWYNPEQSGHGFFIEVLSNNQILAAWYVFDNEGNQAWLLGIGTIEGSHATLNVTLTENGAFPPLFNADNITNTQWGTFEFELNDCNSMSISWQTELQNFSSGNMDISRLTSIDTLSCVDGI